MLTHSAALRLQAQLRRLRQSFAELHEDSLRAPPEQRRRMGLLLASREWEPAAFARLRRGERRT